MPEINSLAFTEIKSEFLDSLKGLCEHDETYSKVWRHVVMRDPSHYIADSVAHNDASSTPPSLPNKEELQRWIRIPKDVELFSMKMIASFSKFVNAQNV